MFVIKYTETLSGVRREVILNNIGDSKPLRFKGVIEANSYLHKHRLYDSFDNIRVEEE